MAVLYEHYGKKLYGYAVKRWQVTEDEAWDLVYKTLYKIIETIDRYTFSDESKLNGFVFRIFINNLRNHYNETKAKRIETVALEEKTGAEHADKKEEPNNSIYMRCLKKILEQLDDWKRILLLMKAQNYRYEEIATYVQRPAEQLKVYHLRAKDSLTKKVNDCVTNHEA